MVEMAAMEGTLLEVLGMVEMVVEASLVMGGMEEVEDMEELAVEMAVMGVMEGE
jgi:uncharacterized protein related to proFAR isomerase